jgi:catecholate siderophore receptor
MHVRSNRLPLVAALMMFGQPVLADEKTLSTVKVEAEAEQTSRETYQTTRTRIGKGEQDLRDIPQSLTVVTERLIDDRNLDTLKETLHNTAGISFLAAEGGEEDIRLRGFSLQASGDIFVDGMRDPAFYERDTFNWDRLEVLRGSASMLFGRGSTGGAVNQVSKEPFLMNQHQIDATIGSGSYQRVVGDFNIKTGDDAALRINAMWNESDAYGTYGAGIDKKGAAATYRFGIGTTDEFLVSLYHLDNNNGIHYGMPWIRKSGTDASMGLVDANPGNYYGMASDYSAGTASHGTLSHIHRFKGGGELRTSFRMGQYERDQRASAIRICQRTVNTTTGVVNNPGCPPAGSVTAATINDVTILTRGSNNKIQDLDAKTLQSDYSNTFDWFGLKHNVQAGIDMTDDDFIGYAATLPPGVTLVKPATTLGSPDDGASVDESARRVLKNRDFTSSALGIYFQDMIQLTPEWKVLAGLRWDRFEGVYRTYSTAAANLGQQTTRRGREDALWSKRFGILYQPTSLASFHFSYGTSFNTSGDAYQYDALGSNTEPEGGRNFELGAKLESESGNLSTRFALFRAEKFNERNRDETSVTPTNYALSGKRHANGFEVDVAGRITSKWEAYVSYAWIPRAVIDKGASDGTTLLQGETVGSRPGLTPKHSGTVWTTYQITGKWRAGGGINWRSAMNPQQSAIMAPGYTTLDLMTEYAVSHDLLLKLNITNVTNKLYADALYRGHYIPGAPRTVQLTASYKF